MERNTPIRSLNTYMSHMQLLKIGNPYTPTRSAPTPRRTPLGGCGPGPFSHIGRKKGAIGKRSWPARGGAGESARKPPTLWLATVEVAEQALKLRVGVLGS
jgi:hypothetical protein